tara:strand:+ start:63 stop:1223 length:1161 start_codon:yes stop_codon:yes gene_type:complete
MKKKKKRLKRYKSKKRSKKVLKKYSKKSKNKNKRKITKRSKKRIKKIKRKRLRKSSNNTILKIIRFQESLIPKFNFNFDLDKTIQKFFQKIADKIEEYKAIKEKENQRKRLEKIKKMQIEKNEAIKKIKREKQLELKEKQRELREEIKLEKERKKDLQKFIRLEQAIVRKEQAEKQRKFLEQIKLEKKIEKFRLREALEIKNLEKFVLSQERESYTEIQERIEKIKQKYQALRDQKIRERVEQLGVKVEEGDDRSVLLEKERQYNLDRQKIEFALESYFRSAHSAVFQINKRWIPKYLSIMRVIDRRFETGEIFIKWDDRPDEDWLMLIYIKDNNPNSGIIVEDKTDPEKNYSTEYQANEIFKFSDALVDSLTNLLDLERKKRKSN